jgi:hypothetical protein
MINIKAELHKTFSAMLRRNRREPGNAQKLDTTLRSADTMDMRWYPKNA